MVETNQLAKRSAKFLSSDELDEFTSYIAEHPEDGDASPIRAEFGRCAGCLSAVANGAGRGSYTSITPRAMPLFLLDFYAKNEKNDLDAHDKKQLRMIVRTILGKD